MFFYFDHAFIFYYGIEFPKSDLFPTKKINDVSAFDLQSQYQAVVAFSKLYGLYFDLLLLADIEDEQNTMATFKVCGYDCSILLLSGRVPDVQFSRFAFESDIFNSEINCGDLSALFRLKLALYKPPKQCSFADITIAYQNKLVFLLFSKR